jgi:homoserine O-acetyltransferase
MAASSPDIAMAFVNAFAAADVAPLHPHSFTADTGAERGEIALTLPLRHAGTRSLRLRYEIVGVAGAPVVVLAGGISAHRHVAANAVFAEKGWAEGLVAAGRALDPAQRRILAFDFIGADGQLDAPIDTADQADALRALLDTLGIAQLSAFVGYSYGALVGLQFALRHPARVAQLVAVSGAHRPHPYASAWRALQRRAVALGQLQCAEAHGLALARHP